MDKFEELLNNFLTTGEVTFRTGGTVSEGKFVKAHLDRMTVEMEDMKAQLGLDSSYKFISTTTPNHRWGFTFQLLYPALTGGEIQYKRVNYPEDINVENAVLVTTPSFLEAMRKYGDLPKINPKIIMTAGAKLEDITFEFAKSIADRVIEIYGSSESGSIAWREDNKARMRLFRGMKVLENTEDYTKIHSNYSSCNPVILEDRIKVYDNGEIEFLDRHGMLSPRTLLIHSIWITPKEKVLIARRGANVNHNPAGNMLLGDGAAPIPDLIAMGVNVGLGVDGASTNNSQDMIETMKLGALLHRNSTLDAGIFTAYDMIKMATIGSAKAIGWADEIGSLEAGKKADLIVVSTDSPAMTPRLANINNLVFSGNGRDVDSVMIDGRFVMKNRQMLLVDEREILSRATQTAQRVAEETGVLQLI